MFFGFFDKRKRKRKNDEQAWYGRRPNYIAGIGLVMIGAIAISTLATFLMLSVIFFGMRDLFSGSFSGQGEGLGTMPTTTPDPRIFDSRFVVIDKEGFSHNFPGTEHDYPCDQLAVSPDRKNKILGCAFSLRLSKNDNVLKSVSGEKGGSLYPAFNRDGTAINYILYEFEKPTYLAQIRLTPEISKPILLAQIRSDYGLAVPPVADPSTGWLLVAEPNDDHTTTFSTIRDTPCTSPRDCEIAKHTIAVVPGETTTADFLPDGTAILYTDKSTLYSVATSDGTRTKIVDVKDIRKIAFNRDGSLLALVDGSRNLYTAPVNNLSQLALVSMPTPIWTFAWAD